MKVRKLRIRNFRGIQKCDWDIPSSFVCLVGPGDSTKTTLLDALGLVLSRSYRPRFTDADFYDCETTRSIKIGAVVTDLPDSLVQESAFGKERSGIRPDGTLEHDPGDGKQDCLIVLLTVDATLEPIWQVIRPREQEGRPISAAQRQQLGFFRVGEDVNLHLRWGRTSALTSMTESQSGVASVILDAQRKARQVVFDTDSQALQETAGVVQEQARQIGSASFRRLRPGLDPTGASSTNVLVLHDESVPLTNHGLGTRRLTSLSVQEQAVDGGSIIAVDEIEHGLEPHRLVHVLRYLRERAGKDALQVFLSTHSPVAVRSVTAQDVVVVCNADGETKVQDVPTSLDHAQGTLRSGPEALLGKTIIVGEGATEVGFLRRLFALWDQARIDPRTLTSITAGLAIVNGGGGSSAVRRAKVFAALGYPTSIMLDNDDSAVDPSIQEAATNGVDILRWSAGCSLEDELLNSLPDAGICEFVGSAAEFRGDDAVRQAVSARTDGAALQGTDPTTWIADVGDRERVLFAIASAAQGRKLDGTGKEEKRAWFKTETGGEALAEIVHRHWQALEGTVLRQRLEAARQRVYEEEAADPPVGAGP